jgi:hypothetical protein
MIRETQGLIAEGTEGPNDAALPRTPAFGYRVLRFVMTR